MRHFTTAEIAGAVILVVFVPVTIYRLYCWFQTARFYGKRFWRASFVAIAVSTVTRRMWAVAVGLGGIGLAVQEIRSRGWTIVAAWAITLGINLLGNAWIPPAAVFLGTVRGYTKKQISIFRKQDPQTPAFRRVQFALVPLKMTHFFEAATDSPGGFVSDAAPFQPVVELHLDIVPIIVLDGRESTWAVQAEAELILKSDELRPKAFFIVQPDGTCAVFDLLSPEAMAAVPRARAVTLTQLLPILADYERLAP